MEESIPKFIPNPILALMPGFYAWQVHTFWIGAGVWLVTTLLLAATGWTFILRNWSMRRLTWVRVLLLVVAMIAVGLSGAEVIRLGDLFG